MIHAVLALGLLGLYFPSALLKATPDSICPVLKAKQDFKMQWFQGQWLLHGTWRTGNALDLECLIVNFKRANETHIKILNRGWDPELQRTKYAYIRARIPDSTDPASWEFSWGAVPADYLILDTDYFDYAIAYICLEYNRARFFMALLLSKTPSPEEHRINEALESASRFGFHKTDFVRLNRTEADCSTKLNTMPFGPRFLRNFQRF